MRLSCVVFFLVCCLFSVTACSTVSDEELQAKIEKCTAAGMDYTYLRDFKNEPYEVMCVSRRLR